MYVFQGMIDLGLQDGQEWPENEAYRLVASTLGLCNPDVVCRDHLIEIVQAVLRVPECDIKGITLEEMREKYSCPV